MGMRKRQNRNKVGAGQGIYTVATGKLRNPASSVVTVNQTLDSSGRPENATLILSICISTYKRAAFIGQTLDSILDQLKPGIEIIVVDGASPDETQKIMNKYCSNNPAIRYFRENDNSGVDADFDKAVDYAKGKYCWLMPDDDCMAPGALDRVLLELRSNCNLLIVNTELRNFDLSLKLDPLRLDVANDLSFKGGLDDKFFIHTANHLLYFLLILKSQ